MFGIFNLASKTKKLTSETLIDVRSYGGGTNHLVRYENYGMLFSLSKAEGREALCGYTSWLPRETPTPENHWVVELGDPKVTTKHYCGKCVDIFHNAPA